MHGGVYGKLILIFLFKMATTTSTATIILLLMLLLFCSSSTSGVNGQSTFFDKVSSYLLSLHEETTHFETLNKNYIQMMSQFDMTRLDMSLILKQISDSLSGQVDIIAESLQNSSDYAGELYNSHIGTGCCSCFNSSCASDKNICNVSYYRARVGGATPPLNYLRYFSNSVNVNHSSVHIPINVYDEDPNVLCFIEWSQYMTEWYKQLWNRLTEEYNMRVTSQYIGSVTGAYRFYPSLEFTSFGSCDNCPYEIVDTYNAGHRPWYIETIPGDKAIVILIDSSGSMSGTRSALARLTARELIKDLVINDFFMVLRVAGEAPDETYRHFGDCFNDFIQATEENKVIMQTLIANDNEQNGRADFNEAIEYSLKELQNISACNKGIVIFSDGDAEFPTEKHSNDTRIFAYQVSVINEESEEMKRLACNNGGFYYLINSYDKVLSGIQFLTNNYHNTSNATVISTHRYIDVFTKGTITTLSLPLKPIIMNGQSNDSGNNDSGTGSHQFVGVMGIDILSFGSDLLTIGSMLGPYGYAFLINNNGYAVYHPILQEVSRYSNAKGQLDDRDLTQFEFGVSDSDKEKIKSVRKQMIDRLTGEMNVSTYVSLEHQKRYITKNMKYYYAPLNSSHVTLSVGIKVPAEGLSSINYPTTPLNKDELNILLTFIGSDEAQSSNILLHGNKPYCYDIYNDNYGNTSHVLQLIDRLIELELYQSSLNSSYIDKECDDSLYIPLLIDLYFIYKNRHLLNNVTTNERISTFIQFSSGLLWCWSYIGFDCTYLFNINSIGLAYNNPDVITTYKITNSHVAAIRPLSVREGVVDVGVVNGGVVGVIITDIMIATNISYLMIDEGGYLIGGQGVDTSTTNDSLNELCSVILNELITNGVYNIHNVTGYAIKPCGLNKGNSSPANKLTGILITFVTMICHILTTMTITAFSAFFKVSESTATGSGCQAIDICQSRVSFNLLNDTIPTTPMEFVCRCDEQQGMTTHYQVTLVNGTNMIGILLNDTSCMVSPVDGVGEGDRGLSEVILPCQCNSMSHQRYRRRLLSTTCINVFQLANRQCNLANSVTFDSLLLLFLIIMQLIITL